MIALAVIGEACGSTSVNVVGPTTSKCQVSVANSMASVPASGASGTLSVDATRDCTWSASTAAAWISITSSSTGQGSGSVGYRVAPNQDPIVRRGMVVVNDQQVQISQEAAPCRFAVSPTSASMGSAGGTLGISVESGGCSWTAASRASWMSISDGASGNGNGHVTVAVAPNSGAARSGTLTIAGVTVTVAQADVTSECGGQLNPTASSVSAAATSGSIAVAIGKACSWTAASSVDWITVTSGAAGTGPGNVQYNVAANPQATPRQGVLTVAGLTFTVSQAALGCSYAIDPTTGSFPDTGGHGAFAVHAPGACAWSATSGASWISIDGAGSGSGEGSVQFTVAANPGDARTGTIGVGGQTFTVAQATSPCTFTLNPSSASIGADGGGGSFGVASRDGCSWSAVSGANWITITSGSNGTGAGTVGYSAAPNPNGPRAGVITVGGARFTLMQGAGCTYTIAPGSQTVPSAGGSASVSVTASGGCSWTATSNAAWITVGSGSSGNGNGTVVLSVAANDSGAARTGTATIAGQTFTVTQDVACTYTLSAPGQQVDAAGTVGSVNVMTGPSCGWTATSNADWISVNGSTASGSGSATIGFAVAANPGPQRMGTITIGGQAFTVTQFAGSE